MTEEQKIIMERRFGHDTLLSVATLNSGAPAVRIVDSVYIGGAFHVITYELSGKMKQIAKDNRVAVCGEWFTAHGLGENLGWVRDEKNAVIMERLRREYSKWYDNGHTNEEDKNTCLLKIHLLRGVLFDNGMRYEIEFD